MVFRPRYRFLEVLKVRLYQLTRIQKNGALKKMKNRDQIRDSVTERVMTKRITTKRIKRQNM
jgi:hypothetical protein